MATDTYTTEGPIRGTCGHRHRSIEAALKCADADHRDCASTGGYSDRRVFRCDGEEMNCAEYDELNRLAERDDRWA